MDKEYRKTIAWMIAQLPMYQQLGKVAFNVGLDNIEKLDKHLNHPHRQFDSIHIAGTNGKGSTCHMLSSILQEAGYKVGLYTSPHLKDYRERIRINGEPITKEAVIKFIHLNRKFFEQHKLSFFEMSVGMAFQYFAENNIDIAIIETGLGGRLDSTNIIQPILSVITNIGMDHIGILGNNIEAIAKEKAGIIKRNTPVVIGEYTKETKSVFKNIAKAQNANIYWVNQNQPIDYNLDLKGFYQKYNARTVLETINILNNQKSKYFIPNKAKINGFQNVVANTGFMGRWQIINESPLTICDTAHNTHALSQVVEQINSQGFETLHIVLGMVSDKEVKDILAILPKRAIYYFCSPNINRALDAKALQSLALEYNLKGKTYESTKIAYETAVENSTIDDFIFIGGSNFVVSEVL